MVTQALYSIEFFDNERNLMPYCYFELYINGNLVTGLPPRADSHGKVWITRELVESMDGIPKTLSIRLWNSTFPKTQNSETEEFIWPEGKTSIKAFLPDVYTINTRPLANENDEEQSYQRAYYLVRKGDTWTKLEIELGSNTVEALMLHNRMSYADQLVEGAKLYYPLGFRTRNEAGSNTEKKPSEKKEERKEEKKAQPRTAKKEPEKKVEQPKKMKEEEKSQKIEKKEEPKPGETKQENTIEQRSQANGKPEEVAKPKKDGCFCYRDLTEGEVENIIKLMRDSEKLNKGKYKVFSAPNCKLTNDEKTYKSLTDEINKAFNKYNIDTCLRKIHFLAQFYLETDRLRTTVEYTNGIKYNPGKHKDAEKNGNTEDGDGPLYIGRGAMQLTWRSNYLSYFKHTRKAPEYYSTVIPKDVTFEKMSSRQSGYSALLGSNLFLAIDSGGWYWTKGSAWGNLNNPADNDDIYKINIGVNGGFNDFKSRISWVKLLIKEYNINECKNLRLNKELGVYRLSDSALSKTKYGKKHEKEFKEYDE